MKEVAEDSAQHSGGRLGRYELLEELGRGAMGTVYRARDPQIGRVVALKTIRLVGETAADDEDYRRRFFREAQAAGRLAHPGIVTIYDAGEDAATRSPYIVMEYIAGRTLEALVADAGGKLAPAAALDLVMQVAEALDYAHAQGVVHRDIKPANILVTAAGRAKIADFGIAKLAMAQLTQTGQVLGTPVYMSPEQVTGAALDGRSDLFSLGVILYWALAGEKPFTGETITEVSFKIVYKDPAPLAQCDPSLGTNFDSVLARALAKDPALRYRRGLELAEDLRILREGRPVLPPAPAVPAAPAPAVEQTVVASQPDLVVTDLRSVMAGRRPVTTWRAPWWVYAALAVIIAAAVIGWFAVRPAAPIASGTLQIRGQHSFRSAALSLWVDGELAYNMRLAGVVKKRLGLFSSVQATSFSGSVPIAAGTHTIRVRVKAEDYDQTRQVEGEIKPEAQRTLVVGFDSRTKGLYLVLR